MPGEVGSLSEAGERPSQSDKTMLNKLRPHTLLLALLASTVASGCDSAEGPVQRFETDIDEATLMHLAELAELDLENDDFVVYAQPFEPDAPVPNEPVVGTCGPCIANTLHLVCLDTSCFALDQAITCDGGEQPGDEWEHEDGINSCYCSDQGETVCTIIGAVTCEDGHQAGDMWDHEDGVNTCHCSQDGEILCTKVHEGYEDYTP